ncbi:zinc finger domain-containing protein [Sphingobium sp. TomTYG75]
MSRNIQPMKDSRRRAAVHVMCPTCGSLPGFLCHGTRNNVRSAIHRDRYAAAKGELPA